MSEVDLVVVVVVVVVADVVARDIDWRDTVVCVLHCHHGCCYHCVVTRGVRTVRTDVDGLQFEGGDGSGFDDATVGTIDKRHDCETPRSISRTGCAWKTPLDNWNNSSGGWIGGFSFVHVVVPVAPDALLLDLGSSHETARIGVTADE